MFLNVHYVEIVFRLPLYYQFTQAICLPKMLKKLRDTVRPSFLKDPVNCADFSGPIVPRIIISHQTTKTIICGDKVRRKTRRNFIGGHRHCDVSAFADLVESDYAI